MFNKCCTLVTCLILTATNSLLSATVQQDLVFTLLPNQSTTGTIRVTPGSARAANVTYSGTIEATVTYDDETLKASSVAFTGGRVFVTDLDVSVSANIFYSGAGTFATTYRSVSRGISGVYSTPPNAPASVDPQTGNLTLNDISLTLNQGTVTATATIPSLSISETEVQNLSSVPSVIGGVDDGLEYVRIQITEVSNNGIEQEKRFTLVQNYNGQLLTESIEGTNSRIESTETGSVTAVAAVTELTAFGSWASAEGLNVNQQLQQERNGGLIPYRLLHALALGSETPSLPFNFTRGIDGAADTLHIDAPEGGLREDVRIEYTTSLSRNTDWQELPADKLLSGPNSLSKGSEDSIRIEALAEGNVFYRFGVPE